MTRRQLFSGAILPQALTYPTRILAAISVLDLSAAVVNLYGWSDYLVLSVIDDVTKDTGVKVVSDVLDSNEILETKLLTGGSGYDVVVPTASFLARQVETGVFLRFTLRKILHCSCSGPKREFVRRTAFAMMAWSVVHRKKEPAATFLDFLPIIEAHATDGRNFVKKAVNWALRSIGKRSMDMHGPALALAQRLAISTDKTARWIGKDAARELSDAKTLERLAARKG